MTKDEEILLRELAGGRCTIQKVTNAIGPMSLWSKAGLEAEIRKAVEAEREACAKICDLAMLQNQEAINELENDEHIAKCFIEGAINQLVKTAKAIRARGKA
jgi:hypothetical protein